jgi:hypothetical protein
MSVDRIMDTGRAIVRELLARSLAGDRYLRMDVDEIDALLFPHESRIEAAIELLRECLRQAVFDGAARVQEMLHAQPGVDHEMLDEAVTFAARQATRTDGDDS